MDTVQSVKRENTWWEKLRNHQIALWALAFTVAGCNLPIAALSVPYSGLAEKVLYSLYLTASVLLLWRFCRLEMPSCWAGLEALLLTYTLVPIMQFTLPMPRPQTSPIEILYGFPSGHAVSLFALAWLVHLSVPRCSVPWFGMATVVALSRVASEYHYGYQVAGGAIIGLLLGWWLSGRAMEKMLSYRVWKWLQARLPARHKLA